MIVAKDDKLVSECQRWGSGNHDVLNTLNCYTLACEVDDKPMIEKYERKLRAFVGQKKSMALRLAA